MPRTLEIQDLWLQYFESRDIDTRNLIIEHYRILVEKMASKMFGVVGRSIPQEDLVAYGYMGLIDAVERFDPTKTAEFDGYAYIRIRGSMIDELRSQDWVPRSVKVLARRVETATDELYEQLMRVPTRAEIAAHLKMTLDEYEAVLVQITGNRILSLDAPIGEDDGATFIDLIVEDAPQEEMLDDSPALDEFLPKLDDRERIIMMLTYVEGLSFLDVANLLGFGESRVSQIHSQAIQTLKQIVKES